MLLLASGCTLPDDEATFDLTWTMDYDAFRENDTRVEDWEVYEHTAGPGPLLRIESASRTGDRLEIQGAIGLHQHATWGDGRILVQAGIEAGGSWNWTFKPTPGEVRGWQMMLPAKGAENADVVIEQMLGSQGGTWDRYEFTVQETADGWNVTYEVDREDCTFGPPTYFLASCDGEPARRNA